MKPSAEEIAGCQQTAYLLGNPVNAARLLASVRAAEAGQTKERDLAPIGAFAGVGLPLPDVEP